MKHVFTTTFIISVVLFGMKTSIANTEAGTQEYLVQLKPTAQLSGTRFLTSLSTTDSAPEALPLEGWYKITALTMDQAALDTVRQNPSVAYIQKNYKLGLFKDYRFGSQALRKAALKFMAGGLPTVPGMPGTVPPDNPEIPAEGSGSGSGADPLATSQWGMIDIGTSAAWSASKTKGADDMIVAVIDTGVDYTHEDLVQNLWYNHKEIPNNQIDDDKNGYVDDIIGWDFASNDNKPYDFTTDPMQLLMGSGNPGHGTHCAGNVAARSDNGKGVAGVAPNVKIMAVRFITEKGQGTTDAAIKAIKYAVDNGAKVLSNSWGSAGEDPNEQQQNQALRDVITFAKSKNVLFVAAAGNGDEQGVGYDNDTNAKPAYPATYPIDNIVSVAAIDSSNALGKFSNWGVKSVHLGAPGVKVFSTMVDNHYSDVVLDIPGFITATWDGTSMATPHVAGAAALYWSKHPEATYMDVKNALIKSATSIPALQGKTVSGGKLNVKALMEL